jgi:hypothetical protein
MRPDLGHCVMLRDRDVRLIVGAPPEWTYPERRTGTRSTSRC